MNGISAFLIRAGGVVRKLQNGFVQSYATLLLFGVSVVLILLYVVGVLR